MKIVISQIKQATVYENNAYRNIDGVREVKGRMLDSKRPNHEEEFSLSSEEVDGILQVGATYEIIFARRAQ